MTEDEPTDPEIKEVYDLIKQDVENMKNNPTKVSPLSREYHVIDPRHANNILTKSPLTGIKPTEKLNP